MRSTSDKFCVNHAACTVAKLGAVCRWLVLRFISRFRLALKRLHLASVNMIMREDKSGSKDNASCTGIIGTLIKCRLFWLPNLCISSLSIITSGQPLEELAHYLQPLISSFKTNLSLNYSNSGKILSPFIQPQLSINQKTYTWRICSGPKSLVMKTKVEIWFD